MRLEKFNNIYYTQQLNESLLDVRQKNASNLSDEQFKHLLSYDPVLSEIPNLTDEVMANTPENYARWLIKMNKLKELDKYSPDQIKQILSTFTQTKKRKNLLPNNDINYYQSISDLENILQNVNQNLTTRQRNRDAKHNQKKLSGEKELGLYMGGAVELLFNGNDWEVWTPHTYEGSKALRCGAVWCTGGDEDRHYNLYTNDGVLFVIINKEDPTNKFQLFVPLFTSHVGNHLSREFRDKNNDELSFRKFIHENKELLDFFLTQNIVTNSYEDLQNPDIDDEWDESREENVMDDYGVKYTDDGNCVCLEIGYDVLLQTSYWTTPEYYQQMASEGFIDDVYDEEWIKNVVSSKVFIKKIDWEDTYLKKLKQVYEQETKNTIEFTTFLKTLFNTEDGYYNDEDLESWFESKKPNYIEMVRNCTDLFVLTYPIEQYVREALIKRGWDINSEYFEGSSYKNRFIYTFEDINTIQEFYEVITKNGELDRDAVCEKYGIFINENKEDISFDDIDYNEYDEDNSSYEIYRLFVSKSNSTNDIDDDIDDEINECLKIAGVKRF